MNPTPHPPILVPKPCLGRESNTITLETRAATLSLGRESNPAQLGCCCVKLMAVNPTPGQASCAQACSLGYESNSPPTYFGSESLFRT
jgi:hypothetical protein